MLQINIFKISTILFLSPQFLPFQNVFEVKKKKKVKQIIQFSKNLEQEMRKFMTKYLLHICLQNRKCEQTPIYIIYLVRSLRNKFA